MQDVGEGSRMHIGEACWSSLRAHHMFTRAQVSTKVGSQVVVMFVRECGGAAVLRKWLGGVRRLHIHSSTRCMQIFEVALDSRTCGCGGGKAMGSATFRATLVRVHAHVCAEVHHLLRWCPCGCLLLVYANVRYK